MNFNREDWALCGDPGPGALVVVNVLVGVRTKTETITYTLYKVNGDIYLHQQEKEEGRTTDIWYQYKR